MGLWHSPVIKSIGEECSQRTGNDLVKSGDRFNRETPLTQTPALVACSCCARSCAACCVWIWVRPWALVNCSEMRSYVPCGHVDIHFTGV